MNFKRIVLYILIGVFGGLIFVTDNSWYEMICLILYGTVLDGLWIDYWKEREKEREQ